MKQHGRNHNPDADSYTPAQEAIQRAFIELYSKMGYANITVKDLCAYVPVARTTFYAYYLGIDHLLEQIENTQITNLLRCITENEPMHINGMDETAWTVENTRCIINYIRENYETFFALLVAQPNERFVNKWRIAIKHNIETLSQQGTAKSNLNLEIIASTAINVHTYFLKNPDTADAAKIEEIVSKVLRFVD